MIFCLQVLFMWYHLSQFSSKFSGSLLGIYTKFCLSFILNTHLGYFYPLSILNIIAMNMYVQASFYVFGCTHRSRIDGSYNNSIFYFISNWHTVLHSSCTILHSHKWCTDAPISLHSHKYLLFSIFNTKCIILICNSLSCYPFENH